MFYIRTMHEGKQITVELHGDEIFSKCFNCGNEMQIDEEFLRDILADGCDLSGTSVACCNNQKPKLEIVK